MTGAMLRSGQLSDFQALGAEGSPVYQSADQLRSAIRRHLDPEFAGLFAVPKTSDRGGKIDWYAPKDGVVVPWSAASPEERQQAKVILKELRAGIGERSGQLAGDSNRERRTFGRLLALSTRIPDETHLYLVDGQPVITFWGFVMPDDSQDHDVIADVIGGEHTPVPTPGPAAVPPPVTATPTGVEERRGFFARFPIWLWPLLLLLLLLLLFLLLRGCEEERPAVTVDEEVAPPIVQEEEDPQSDTDVLPPVQEGETQIVPCDSAVEDCTRRGVDVDMEGDGGGLGPGTIPGTDGETGVPQEEQGQEDPGQEDQGQEDTPPTEEQSETLIPPVEDEEEPAQDDQQDSQSETEKGPPMVIPPKAEEEGGVDFLDGSWRSQTGLVDAKTGKPLELEYEFADGMGEARVRRDDGTVCKGPVTAAMQGADLVIEGKGDIICPDGVGYAPSTVTCSQGEGDKAQCKGSYADGDDYSVDMQGVK